MERRIRGNSYVRCETGEKWGITSNTYLSSSLGGAQGQATDIEIQANRIVQLKEKLNSILSDNTGQSLDVIKSDTERDCWKTSEEALSYGLIDKVLYSKL